MGNQMDKVLPGLYVGRAPNSLTVLQENNITHILSVHDEAKPVFKEFSYKCVQISDTPGVKIGDFFEECIEFIHDCRSKGGTVLIHCMAGISRAVTMTTMYLMTVSSLGYRDCLKVVKFCRPIAAPNIGFINQLDTYERERLHRVRKEVRDRFAEYDYEADNKALEELLKKALEKPL
jgi:protein-tyrosine phosphatase